MATQTTQPSNDKPDDTTPVLTPEQNKRREVKELKTKLTNMSPLATAEVVNEVVARQVFRQVSGFTDFLREQGVVGLAIGLVFGIQVKAVVDQFMASFVSPVLSLVLPGNGDSFARKSFTVSFHGKTQTFVWGQFVLSILTLLIVAAIIYTAYNMLRLDKLSKKKDK